LNQEPMPRPALSVDTEVDTERQAPPSLSTLDSGGESPLDQSPAWQKTISTLQRLYGDSPSGKGTRRLSFGDRAGRKSLILSSPELEKGDSLDARLGKIDNCNAEKNRSERRRRRSCTGGEGVVDGLWGGKFRIVSQATLHWALTPVSFHSPTADETTAQQKPPEAGGDGRGRQN
jgi:hypothetical protein